MVLKSQIYRLYYYKAFGYKYIDDGFLLENTQNYFSSIENLNYELGACQLCELAKNRKNVILPSGNLKSKIMFVFENPHFNDDIAGSPYNGQLGEKFLDILSECCELEKDDFITTFLIKCNIPQNKKITRDILLKCAPYIFSEINLVKPKLVVSFGELCSKILLRNNNLPDMSVIHGSILTDSGISFLPTFDAKYIIANPSKFELFKNDLRKIVDFI